jgi:hypothetical protein
MFNIFSVYNNEDYWLASRVVSLSRMLVLIKQLHRVDRLAWSSHSGREWQGPKWARYVSAWRLSSQLPRQQHS